VSEAGERHVVSRSRVGHALLCPFCRDDVPAREAVACARRGCGALYHRECWEECIAKYGGCAIYGCVSKQANGLSRPGYRLRLFRLMVAALVFPPRAARALVRATTRTLPPEQHVPRSPEETTPYDVGMTLVGWLLMSFIPLYIGFLIFMSFHDKPFPRGTPWYVSVGFDLLVMLGPFVLLFALMIILSSGSLFLTGLEWAFRDELALLTRGEYTVIERLGHKPRSTKEKEKEPPAGLSSEERAT
jgi:hypothetical protein